MFTQNPQSAKTKVELPTWLQFLKASGKKSLPKRFLVSLIWKPGKWDNFTLQTEKFRLRIPADNAYFKELQANLETLCDKDIALFIAISDRDEGTYTLETKEDEPGHWDFIGENGVKWQPPN